MATPPIALAKSILSHIQASLEAQAHIDRQILELQEAVCKLQAQINTLRTQRNTLSPISRLPSELLSAIFIYCARTDSVDDEPSVDSCSTVTEEMGGDLPGWVNVSYVCRHWRGIALNSPTLWTHIFPISQRWTEILLSRSKQAPLRVTFNSRMLHSLKRVLVHMKRIQELELGLSFYDYRKVFDMLSSPAPLLRSLIIDGEKGAYKSVTLGSWPVFNVTAPALCRLELSRCPVPRFTSTLGSLITLILRRSIQLTIADFVTALRSMENLVHLELHYSLYSPRGQQNTPTTSTIGTDELRLPHLLRLAVKEPPSHVISLLSCLDISSKTKVRLQIISSPSEDEWMTLRSLLVKRFFMPRDDPSPSIRTLMVGIHNELEMAFAFNGSENMLWRSKSLDWNCDVPIQVAIVNDDASYTVPYIVQDAYCSGFLAGLQSASVTVSFEEDWDCSILHEGVFGFVPELRSIQLIGARSSLTCLCSFLSFIRHDDTARLPPNTSFGNPLPFSHSPGLEELTIRRSRFDHTDDLPNRQDRQRRDSASDLYDALAIRKEKGYTLNRLTLGECRNLFKEDVDKLKTLVTELIWDGIEVDEC